MLSIMRHNAHNQTAGFLNYGMPPFSWTLYQAKARKIGILGRPHWTVRTSSHQWTAVSANGFLAFHHHEESE